MTREEKIECFKDELSWIKSPEVKSLTEKALAKVPDAFYSVAASSTGKYHPAYAAGEGGLIRHVKAAVLFAEQLKDLEMFHFDELTKDFILAALILHDTCKGGLEWKQPYAFDHPLLVRKLLTDEELSDFESFYWEEINDLISTHMGQWTTSNRSKVVLPAPQTSEQKFVHLCDYLASRKAFDVPALSENEVSNTEYTVVRPATEPQQRFVAALINKAKKLPDYDPKYNAVEVYDLTSSQASILISELRDFIGDE